MKETTYKPQSTMPPAKTHSEKCVSSKWARIPRGTCARCHRQRPLPYLLAEGRGCSACYHRKDGHVALVEGPCSCGCGRPARGRSGFSKTCYEAVWRRAKNYKKLTGTALHLNAVLAALVAVKTATALQRAALDSAIVLLGRIQEGAVVIQRNAPRPDSTGSRPNGGPTAHPHLIGLQEIPDTWRPLVSIDGGTDDMAKTKTETTAKMKTCDQCFEEYQVGTGATETGSSRTRLTERFCSTTCADLATEVV